MMTNQTDMLLLEGTDNSGKSTVAKILAEQIPNSVVLRDPDYFREIITGDPTIEPRTRFYLYMAAREELLAKQILPAIAEGRFIIQDRLHISTNVYQGYVSGIPQQEIREIDNRMLEGIRIKPVILLTRVETALKRQITEGEDFWERSGKLGKILEGYVRYAMDNLIPYGFTDYSTPEEVADYILERVLGREV